MIILGPYAGELHSSPNTGMNAINLKQQEAFKMNPFMSIRKLNMGALMEVEAL